jgi:hypothetical protein
MTISHTVLHGKYFSRSISIAYRAEGNSQAIDGLGVPLLMNLLLKAFLEA